MTYTIVKNDGNDGILKKLGTFHTRDLAIVLIKQLVNRGRYKFEELDLIDNDTGRATTFVINR